MCGGELMNYVFFKCLSVDDYHIHIFSDPLKAVKFLHLNSKTIASWRKFYNANGYSMYPRLVKGYALVFLEEGSEQQFFEMFSDACINLTAKLVQTIRPLVIQEGGDYMYNNVIRGQDVRDKAIALVDWLIGYILAPRALLYSRGFSPDELIWLQAYIGKSIPVSMPGLKKLNY
jgi:hypothetical protein